MFSHDPPSVYATALGGFFVFVLALCLLTRVVGCAHSPRTQIWVHRHLQAEVLKRTRLTSPVSRGDLIVQALYWCGTACYNLIGVTSTDEASRRAVAAGIFNSVPLLLGDRLDFAASAFAVSRQTYRKIHNTIGLMTVVQMSVHVGLQKIQQQLDLQNLNSQLAITVSHAL